MERPPGWFRKAAAKGHPGAAAHLGAYLFNAEEYADAFAWFEKAAIEGEADAAYNLATCYERGLGCDADDAKAARWLETAADAGLSKAQYALGTRRRREGEYARGYALIDLAARQGLPEAEYEMADANARGLGVPVDAAAATAGFASAARKGHGNAMRCLAWHMIRGSGCDVDVDGGEDLLLKAAVHGAKQAEKDFKKLESRKRKAAAAAAAAGGGGGGGGGGSASTGATPPNGALKLPKLLPEQQQQQPPIRPDETTTTTTTTKESIAAKLATELRRLADRISYEVDKRECGYGFFDLKRPSDDVNVLLDALNAVEGRYKDIGRDA